ncbi:hypothetical protein P886_2924 [Alteromonadaceae bacterium 2753L.S.0a.02]|nr:hypothetical protein P886_2924 [Alteromonadaceae bacterium 2753L.S.0a.02]
MITTLEPSQHKHEHDIPQYNLRDTLQLFNESRKQWLIKLKHERTFPINPDCKLAQLHSAVMLGDVSQDSLAFLYKLEKAFIVRGSIEHLLKPPHSTNHYLLLASCLLKCYETNDDLNGLNSSIRLLDFVRSEYQKGNTYIDCELAADSITRELRALEKINS